MTCWSDPSELIPRPGKDERFDEVVREIASLEKELEGELKKFEKTLGFVVRIRIKSNTLIVDTGLNSYIGIALLVTR